MRRTPPDRDDGDSIDRRTYLALAGAALGTATLAGCLGGDDTTGDQQVNFGYGGGPFLLAAGSAALAAATGRLIDELMQEETIRSAYVNLPFGAIAVGLVIRGFSEYFLERAGAIDQFRMGPTTIGPVTIDAVSLESGPRLALFILGGILVSLIGVRFAAYFSQSSVQEEFVE